MLDPHSKLDLVIIGGGPAGMAAALVAGRARLKTLVLNAESPRNAVAHASHGFLTRDGVHSSELLRIAKEQLGPYPSVQYERGVAISVVVGPAGAQIRSEAGQSWVAERVVFATGYRTDLAPLNLPDIEAVYGKSVFPCPFCDGFEVADKALAVFSWSMAEKYPSIIRLWSENLVVFTHGKAVADEALSQLQAKGIRVESSPVVQLLHRDGMLHRVRLQDGTEVDCEAGFLGEQHAQPASDLPGRLGVERVTNAWGMEHYQADELGKTSVERVYVLGDLKRVFGGIAAAAFDGYQCAAGIAHEIALS